MGPLNIPPGALVYTDAQILIYSVETHARYSPLLRDVWTAAKAGGLTAVSSELCVLECLVHPLRTAHAGRVRAFESFFAASGFRTVPVTLKILRAGAQLRADVPALRTPDAIHAATSTDVGANVFLTNDQQFRGIKG